LGAKQKNHSLEKRGRIEGNVGARRRSGGGCRLKPVVRGANTEQGSRNNRGTKSRTVKGKEKREKGKSGRMDVLIVQGDKGGGGGVEKRQGVNRQVKQSLIRAGQFRGGYTSHEGGRK